MEQKPPPVVDNVTKETNPWKDPDDFSIAMLMSMVAVKCLERREYIVAKRLLELAAEAVGKLK